MNFMILVHFKVGHNKRKDNMNSREKEKQRQQKELELCNITTLLTGFFRIVLVL